MYGRGIVGLYPMMRITLMLIAGIAAGDALFAFVSSAAWLSLAVVATAFAILARRQPIMASSAVVFSVLSFGAWTASMRKADLADCIVDVPIEYKAIVADEPSVHGKIVTCNLLIVQMQNKNRQSEFKPFVVRASIMLDTANSDVKLFAPGTAICARSLLDNDFSFTAEPHFRLDRWAASHSIKANTFIRRGKWMPDTLTAVEQKRISMSMRLRLHLLQYRNRIIRTTWDNNLTAESRTLVEAVALGSKSKITRSMREAYSIAGVSHVLALSGLHLGIIYAVLSLCLTFFFRRVERKEWVRLLLQSVIVVVLWAYVFLVCFPPGAVRSATMLSLYAVVSLLNRKRMSANSLAFAAVVMLVLNPMLLWDVAFQLSFVSVLSIFVFYSPLYNFVRPATLPKSVATLWSIICVSLAAQIGTAPLLVYYFGRLSTYFLFSNLVAIPLITLLLYAALLSILLHPVLPLYNLCIWLINTISSALNTSVSFFASLPYSSADGLHISTVQLFIIYLLIAVVYGLCHYFFRRRKVPDV